jgi:Tfp pilus assembly protein PilX
MRHISNAHHDQRGATLLITLIAVVLLSLAAAAMMRAVDSGGLIVGNIAFRQASVHVSDIGVESARAWLLTQSNAMIASGGTVTTLYGPVSGRYFSTWGDFDPKTYNWTDNTLAYHMTGAELPPGMTGYSVYWVVHRMCKADGPPADSATSCIKVSTSATVGDSQKVMSYGDYNKSATSEAPYYRITARVDGPRATTTYVQAIVY